MYIFRLNKSFLFLFLFLYTKCITTTVYFSLLQEAVIECSRFETETNKDILSVYTGVITPESIGKGELLMNYSGFYSSVSETSNTGALYISWKANDRIEKNGFSCELRSGKLYNHCSFITFKM